MSGLLDTKSRLTHQARKASASGIVAWDCRDQEEIMLVPYGLFLAGDNPMQAEECSQSGLASNHYCRTCLVGGTKEYKGSEVGYRSLFKVRLLSVGYLLEPNLY